MRLFLFLRLGKMAADGAQEDHDCQGHKPFMLRHARIWSKASNLNLKAFSCKHFLPSHIAEQEKS